jgi:2-polyprenyl-3-methyl-5-hydroxy-6-metoxy-1,4-benzoquinol methylase
MFLIYDRFSDCLQPSFVRGDDKIRILDLGCGNGSFSNVLNQLGYDVVGVEESASGIAIAQQQYPDCKFIEASIYDLPYSQLKPEFDVVISVEVIEHLFDPKQLIRSAKQCYVVVKLVNHHESKCSIDISK